MGSIDELEDVDLETSSETKLDDKRDGRCRFRNILLKFVVVGFIVAALAGAQLLLEEDAEENDLHDISKNSIENYGHNSGGQMRSPWQTGNGKNEEEGASSGKSKMSSKWITPSYYSETDERSKWTNDHQAITSKWGTVAHHEANNEKVTQANEKEIEATHKRTPGATPAPPEMWSKLDNHYCIKQDGDVDNTEEEWLSRAPRAILLGAMKSGTAALSHHIRQHPSFLKPKLNEMHFFDYNFDDYVTENGILYKEARQAYSEWFHQDGLVENSAMLALDNSPRYLFWSDRIPQRIMCVAPHAKLLVVMRDPVERAFSNYNHATKRQTRSRPSFEDLIKTDLEQLRQSGVLQDWSKVEFERFSGSLAEREAWNHYVRTARKGDNIVGRSLYALQLQQWFDAMYEAGKPLSDMMIVQSELLASETEDQLSKIWTFLGVDDIALSNHDYSIVGSYSSSMNNETRDELHKLFHPYNQRLYAMLGPEWEGVWD